MPDMAKITRLLTYLRPYWAAETLTFLIMAAIAVLSISIPAALQYLIDRLITALIRQAETGINSGPVVVFGLVLIGIYTAQFLLSWARDYLAAYIGANIIATLRSQLFLHLERLSLSFFQRSQVGEIMSRFLSDINRIQNLMTTTLLVFLTDLLLLAAIMIYLLNINWYLTLIALLPVPLTILLTNRFGLSLHHLTRRLQEHIAALSASLQEKLAGIRVIKSFGQEISEKKRIDRNIDDLTGLYIKTSVLTSVSSQLINLLSAIGPIVILAWGTYLIAGGSMLLGELIAFYVLLGFLYSPIQGLATINIEVQAAMASVNRVFEYLDLPPAVLEDSQPIALPQARGEIEFEHVGFCYEAGGFCLDDVSFNIRAGEKVALVGPSGSGKSTIANLLMRFYDPQKGRVRLDGIDLKKLSFDSRYGAVAMVDQDPLLFRTSIYDNIAYAKPDATQEDVEQAARNANIHDFIAALPQGYQTIVGERGVTLSGGERQRICLARAILKNPAVLILDEATSALDSVSEQLIREALGRILKDKAAVIIAHRLSTVQAADRIIVIDRGHIIAEDAHAQLLDSCPLYRELAQKQMWG